MISYCECDNARGTIKDSFYIGEVSHKTAMFVFIEKHYLHRSCQCSFSFALRCKSCNKIVGVISYGTPSSSTLRSGICGLEYKDDVIELNRLWVRDGTPKNTESFFIGNTIKKVDKEIVVSFADTEQNHIGIIYQATNWIYTGLSAKRTNWVVCGIDKHSQTIADKYSSKEARELFGERFKLEERSRKHRYVYFNCNKKKKKLLMSKLKYPILQYPKSNK